MTKMIVGLIRSVSQNTGRSLLLDGVIQKGDSMLFVHNVLVLTAGVTDPGKLREEFDLNACTKRYIIDFDSTRTTTSEVIENGVTTITIPAFMAHGPESNKIFSLKAACKQKVFGTAPVSFLHRGAEVQMTSGLTGVEGIAGMEEFARHAKTYASGG